MRWFLLYSFSWFWLTYWPSHGLANAVAEPEAKWKLLSSIPDAVGFAAPFVGTHGEMLIVAGGANFPQQPPWEGGIKKWHDRVFVLDSLEGQWREAGRLPQPRAYGVSVSTNEGVYCIGGSDDQQHLMDSVVLQWDAQRTKLRIIEQGLPSLPSPCANACGAILDGVLYLAGGQEKPDSTNAEAHFWSLDLKSRSAKTAWKPLPSWPGPARILATAVVVDGAFYVIGGAELSRGSDGKAQRRWLRDAYRYHPHRGWERIADLPRPIVAAPSPALAHEAKQILYIAGGDDGSQLHTPPLQHLGFPRSPCIYEVKNDRWSFASAMPFSFVTINTVIWKDHYLIPGGEIRPGTRSTQVWALPPF